MNGCARRLGKPEEFGGRAYLAPEHMQILLGIVGKRPHAHNHHRRTTPSARRSNVLPAHTSHIAIMKGDHLSVEKMLDVKGGVVPTTGLEPARHEPRDFKSLVSTYSTTWARKLRIARQPLLNKGCLRERTHLSKMIRWSGR